MFHGIVLSKSEFTISHKKRLQDPIKIDGSYQTVSALIENNPLKLWDIIHTRGSGVSLVRPAYAILKKEVTKIDIERVKSAEKTFLKYKLKRKYQKECSDKKIGTNSSKFRLIKSVRR